MITKSPSAAQAQRLVATTVPPVVRQAAGGSLKTIYDFGLTPESVRRFVVSVAGPANFAFKYGRKREVFEAEPGEMRLKEWLAAEANRLGIDPDSVHMRLRRGKYPGLKLRRMNRQNIFVQVGQ